MSSTNSNKRKVHVGQNGAARCPTSGHNNPGVLATTRMSLLDEQARALKAAQDRIQAELLELLRERNSLATINRIPIELLSTIFEWVLSVQGCGSRYRDRSPLNIAQVCSYWRSVCLETPEVWSDIRIGYGTGLNQGFHDKTLSHLTETLERTGSVPLHVSYKHHGSQQDHGSIEQVIDALRREAHRIRTLRTVDQVITNNLWDSLPNAMPQLESLYIAQANTHHILVLVPFEQIPFRLVIHSLKTLYLQHVALQIFEQTTTLEGLRELYLYHSLIQRRAEDTMLPGPGDFTPQEDPLSLDFLRLVPNLEVLSIKHVYVNEIPAADEPFCLHQLKKLVLLIMEDPPETGALRLPMILDHLDMPKLLDLELWGQPLEQISPRLLFNRIAVENFALQRLAFRHAVIPGKSFLALLSHLKDLRVLDCLNTTIIRPVLKALRRLDTATDMFQYAPKLEELHFRALQDHLQVAWVTNHLTKTLHIRQLVGAPLKKLSVYPLHNVIIRRLRAYVPYIITDYGRRITPEYQDKIERCGEIEDGDIKFHFQFNRVYYDRANGVGVDDDDQLEDLDMPEFAASDSSDDEDSMRLDVNFNDLDDVEGIDAMLNPSDPEEEGDDDEVDWSTDGDGMTDGDFMTEADGFTEGDASFIGSDPVTDMDFGMM